MLSISLMFSSYYPRHHEFRHEFQYLLNIICTCENDIETTIHYLLYRSNFSD